jgi:hypothetical protein
MSPTSHEVFTRHRRHGRALAEGCQHRHGKVGTSIYPEYSKGVRGGIGHEEKHRTFHQTKVLTDRLKFISDKAGKSEKPVWYVSSKCEDKFYVKSVNNCEVEIKISRKEILCSYKLICPGDKVKVIPSCLADKHSVQITKYVNGIIYTLCSLKCI